MASGKTLNARNLAALGAERLAELLLELAEGDAAAKRQLRLELTSQSGDGSDVVAEIRKRLNAIAKSRSFVDWQRIRMLAKDLEAQRAAGRQASPTRYVWTATREYFRDEERTSPILTLELPGEEPTPGIALLIVQNTAPWTFFGPFPINPCPRASFDTGLDVFAPHSLGIPSTVRYGLRMLRGSRAGSVAGQLTALHDVAEFMVSAEVPVSLQLDGDWIGEVDSVRFRAAPRALRIVG